MDDEGINPIEFGSLGHRSRSTLPPPPCKGMPRFALSIVQRTDFIHICRMVRERYLYIFRQKVKSQGHNGTLSTLWDWHNNLNSFQHTAFIFLTLKQGGERKTPLHFVVKRSRSQQNFVKTWIWHNNLSTCSFQGTAFIFHTKMQNCETNIPLHFGARGLKFKVIA